MRDPWFPIALFLIVLLAMWLGIRGPLPDDVIASIQKWQTLIAGGVASVAALIAFRNATRSLQHAEKLESYRRQRKHAALRAVLPLALVKLSDYAEGSAYALNDLVKKCNGETLPPNTVPDRIGEPVPEEALETLAEFIEYSDEVEVGIFASTVALIQIHDSRLRSYVTDNRDLSGRRAVVRMQLEGRIIDAAKIHAGAAAGFEYALRG